jgi:hypothetical protein
LRRAGLSILVLVLLAVGPASASASQLLDRNATRVQLKVARNGVAQISYRLRGRQKKILAWGALNAVVPVGLRSRQQLFAVNYGNGHGSQYAALGRRFKNACRRYDGPKLPWLVVACKAPDGSYWALQSWQRILNDWGHPSNAHRRSWELRLSHWKGALPVITVKQDWSWGGQWQHFYGNFTYRGKPLHGFKTDRLGAPLDKFGVLVFMDTFNSAYGKGWVRETGWVTHRGSGVFCYSMNPHGKQPAGSGQKYRITVQSPGALPDIFWQGKPVGAYDRVKDEAANEDQRRNYASPDCKVN